MNKKEEKSFVDRQKILFGYVYMIVLWLFFSYSFGLSIFSPIATLYQLKKVTPNLKVSPKQASKLGFRILPSQTLLKLGQMNISSPVCDYLNPWLAFGVVGVFQGAVYGHSNIYFVKHLLPRNKNVVSYAGLFRGFLFAGLRDMISQGVPYIFAHQIEMSLKEKINGKNGNESKMKSFVVKWSSVVGTSLFATILSQGLHNFQLTMHADHTITSHAAAVRQSIKTNGFKVLYKGCEARVGFMLLVNIANDLFLKHAWD